MWLPSTLPGACWTGKLGEKNTLPVGPVSVLAKGGQDSFGGLLKRPPDSVEMNG